MPQDINYPIICCDNVVKTVDFYEDFFNYVPEEETDSFVLMRHAETGSLLGLASKDYKTLPEEVRAASSSVLINMPVKNVDAAYQEYYWEGLDLHGEPGNEKCGRRHFMVRDPNGVFIDVMQSDNDNDIHEIQGLHDAEQGVL